MDSWCITARELQDTNTSRTDWMASDCTVTPCVIGTGNNEIILCSRWNEYNRGELMSLRSQLHLIDFSTHLELSNIEVNAIKECIKQNYSHKSVFK